MFSRILPNWVILNKFEKGSYGVPTEIPVPGAKFNLYRVGQNGALDEQIDGIYTSGSDGRIYAPALPSGEYYFLETAPPPGFTYDQDEHGQTITRYEFTIVDASRPFDLLVLYAYNRPISGSLIIEKVVKNADGTILDISGWSDI